jgi:hypothetical protein
MDVNALYMDLRALTSMGYLRNLFDAHALEEIKLFSYFVIISLFTCPNW